MTPGLRCHLDPAATTIIRETPKQLCTFDHRIGQELIGDAPHRRLIGICIDQEDARGPDRPDLRAELGDLVSDGLAHGIQSA